MPKYKGTAWSIVVPVDVAAKLDALVARMGVLQPWRRVSRNEALVELVATGLPALERRVALEETKAAGER